MLFRKPLAVAEELLLFSSSFYCVIILPFTLMLILVSFSILICFIVLSNFHVMQLVSFSDFRKK
jgi:hypothetical protein